MPAPNTPTIMDGPGRRVFWGGIGYGACDTFTTPPRFHHHHVCRRVLRFLLFTQPAWPRTSPNLKARLKRLRVGAPSPLTALPGLFPLLAGMREPGLPLSCMEGRCPRAEKQTDKAVPTNPTTHPNYRTCCDTTQRAHAYVHARMRIQWNAPRGGGKMIMRMLRGAGDNAEVGAHGLF